MSDQQAPGNGDMPAVAGPNEAPGTAQDLRPPEGDPNDPYEKRYHDVRDWADRVVNEKHHRAQELERQYEQAQQAQKWYEIALTSEDEATRRQALETLGYELPEQDEEEFEPVEYDDPYDELRAEINGLREWRDQAEQGSREAQEAQIIRAVTDERLSALEGLAPEDHDMVLAYAINALPPLREPGVPVPLPDVQGAFEYFQARETERQKAWASTKRAPYVPAGGLPANEVPDPGTGHNARMNRAMREIHDTQ